MGSATAPNGTTTQQSTVDKASFCTQNPNDPACSKPSDCDKHPDLVQCKELGTPADEGALSSVSVGVASLTPVDLPGVASCPANVPLPHGSYFDWTPTCTYATALRPLVLALAWLAAGIIVLGFSRA